MESQSYSSARWETLVWNRGGEELAGIHELRGRIQDPNAVVWGGDAGVDPSQRGLKVLGAPIGCDEFVSCTRRQPNRPVCCRKSPQSGIFGVRGYCCIVRPRLSEEFVEAGGAVWQCFCQLVGIAADSEKARGPNEFGRLGLCLAAGSAEAAHWASSADCIPSVKRRHPDVAEATVTFLNHHEISKLYGNVRTRCGSHSSKF